MQVLVEMYKLAKYFVHVIRYSGNKLKMKCATLHYVVWMVFSLFAHCIQAQNIHPHPIKVGVSFSIPPWVIREDNSGIELDILREAFAIQGVEVQPVYMAFSRVYDSFDAGELDGVVNVKPGAVKGGYLSQPVVTFQNNAISLTKKNFPEEISVDFLLDKSVVGFQRASQLLGDDFRLMSLRNAQYSEVAKQFVQLNLLFVREVDFIVMDKSIFGYYWRKAIDSDWRHGDAYRQAVSFHPIFGDSDYSFVFRDRGVRDTFDEGLNKLRASGAYAAIIEKYDKLVDLYEFTPP